MMGHEPCCPTSTFLTKMFRVCLVTVFSPYFLFSKIIFYFLDYKTCLATQNRQKTKTISKLNL